MSRDMWAMRNGARISIRQMGDRHLLNAIALLEARSLRKLKRERRRRKFWGITVLDTEPRRQTEDEDTELMLTWPEDFH